MTYVDSAYNEKMRSHVVGLIQNSPARKLIRKQHKEMLRASIKQSEGKRYSRRVNTKQESTNGREKLNNSMPPIPRTGVVSTTSNSAKTPQPTTINFYDKNRIGSQLVKNRRKTSIGVQKFDSKVDLQACKTQDVSPLLPKKYSRPSDMHDQVTATNFS